MNAQRLLKHFERISEAPDAVPRLRRFILDLAVRGKLVEQDPGDEPASELLKRIRVEKARHLKNGKFSKEKLLPQVDEAAVPFDVPTGWEWVRIRQVTSDRGQTIPSAKFSYIDVTAIDKEAGRIAETKVLTADEAPSRARKLVQAGDVIYSCVRPYLLNIAIVESEIVPPPIASTAFAVLNGFGLVHSRYLWIVLRSSFMIECVEARMKGQAYPAINDSDFALLPLPLPPLAEQHRIVAKVDELMALCDRLEAAHLARESRRDRLVAASLHRLNNGSDAEPFREYARFHLHRLPRLTTRPDHIQHLRQTILNLSVRGRLIPQDLNNEPASKLLEQIQAEKARLEAERICKKSKSLPSVTEDEKPFVLPLGWEWSRLQSLVFALGDGLHGTPTYVDGTKFYFINGNNLVEGKIVIKSNTKTVSFDEMQKHKKPMSSNTVLVSINGTLGNVAFYNDEQVVLGKSACYFNLSECIDKHFVRLVIESQYFIDYALRNATGTTIRNLSLRAMNEFPVPLPPLAEQRRIVAKVEELMTLCNQLTAQLTDNENESYRLLEAVLGEALAPSSSPSMQRLYGTQGKSVMGHDPTVESPVPLIQGVIL